MRVPYGPPLVWRRPDLLGDGQTAFWQGRFAQARDYFEAEGLVARGPLREHIQGLAEIASGFLRCDEGVNWHAERLLRKGLHHLAEAPDEVESVHVASIRDAAKLLYSALKRGQPADPRGLVHQAA